MEDMMVGERAPDFEQFRRAVLRQNPDRVPLAEALIEYPIQSQFIGREVTSENLEAQVEFWSSAGYDYIPLAAGMMSPGKVTAESAISKLLQEVAGSSEDEKRWNLELTSFINNHEDFERFPWEAAANVDLSKFAQVAPLLPPHMKVIAVSGKIFTLSWMLMGFNNLALSLIEDEAFLSDVVGKVAEIQMKTVEAVAELPHVGGIWLVDDIAFGAGPMLPPQAFRDHLFPHYRRLVQHCHDKGLLAFFHSDGDLTALLDELTEIGIDMLHPIDPGCMDIVKLKKTYGERFALAGNVSNEMLRSATVAEVREHVRALIRDVGRGGGYCVGSGNSVPHWARFDNYCAMREAALEYGRYPAVV